MESSQMFKTQVFCFQPQPWYHRSTPLHWLLLYKCYRNCHFKCCV